MIVKTEEELKLLMESGKRLGHVLSVLKGKTVPGINTRELDEIGADLIHEMGDAPAFLGYTPYGAKRAYPASICISVNDEIVHGIPNEPGKDIQEGDIVSLDAGLIHEGYITDSAVTVIAGKGDENASILLKATEQALMAGIQEARTGKRTGDIGAAIQAVAQKYNLGVFRELAGHGVGRKVHEAPDVPNFGRRGTGEKLEEGLVIAIEPMFGEGKGSIRLLRDGYTYATKDGSRAAHFEHTIVVRKGEPIILTKRS